jgi:ferrochelatase
MGVSEPIGVLVMAYGTADGPDDIERYYTDIRGGRAPAPHHLKELTERYAAIGNRFPLLEITREQAAGLERELNSAGGGRFRSYLGMKHSPPFIPEGVARMKTDGIRRAVGLVMAPHWSGMSIETYAGRARAAIEEQRAGIDFTYVRQWYDHPAFVGFLAARVRAALDTLPEDERGDTAIVFSAHSLPQRSEEDGTTRCLHCSECPEACAYRAQLLDTADLVAGRLGLEAYTTGWQSAGRTADPWLGPPVEDLIGELAAQGHPAVVVCSAGFVADHLEILYDLDIEAQGIAAEAGVRLVRTEMPNADPAFIRVLADVVRAHLGADVSQPA